MSIFDQQSYACRCEWGLEGIDALARADVTVIVDVLSFSTCVDVAVGRGITVLPYRWRDESAASFAIHHEALLAGSRGSAGLSLSPGSFRDAETGSRCVLPSLNGATLVLHAKDRSSIVIAGCLRNARAVAIYAQRAGKTYNIIPAGERWPSDSLRPGIEDLIGAGAILSCLPGSKSPEAENAVAAFEKSLQSGINATLFNCSSGRELLAREFQQDVEIAAEINVSHHVPRFNGLEFEDASCDLS